MKNETPVNVRNYETPALALVIAQLVTDQIDFELNWLPTELQPVNGPKVGTVTIKTDFSENESEYRRFFIRGENNAYFAINANWGESANSFPEDSTISDFLRG